MRTYFRYNTEGGITAREIRNLGSKNTMKKVLFTLSLLTLAVSCPAETITLDNDVYAVGLTWKSLGGNFRRTGLSESSGPELGCVRWQFETDGAVATSVTVGIDGRVHIACEDGKLHTLEANGSPLWIYDAKSPLLSSPSLGLDGTICVGSENGELHAIGADGNLLWTQTTDGPIYSSPAVSEEGNVYVGSQDGRLYALDRDGSELWRFETQGPGVALSGSIFASPAIGADGTVYVGGLYDSNLYALDSKTGNLKWQCRFESGGWPFASPVVAEDGTIYRTLLYDSSLYAIEPSQGTIIWSTDLADPCSAWFDPDADGWSEPALGPDGTIYVSLDDPYVRALDPNGTIKWVTRLGVLGGFTLTVGGDGLIYAAGDDGYLRVVDPNGMEVAQFRSDGWLNFPVIAADNVIIVSDANDHSMLITDANNTVWVITGYGCADLNADETVNLADLARFALDWLECTDPNWPCNYVGEELYLAGDIRRDLYVDFADFAAIADRWLADVGWLKPPPCLASNPNPADGAIAVSPPDVLSWTGCPDTLWHDVYFGTDQAAVATATSTTWGIYRGRQPHFDTNYWLFSVEWDTTYYWRIDEVSSTETRIGTVWHFTVTTQR